MGRKPKQAVAGEFVIRGDVVPPISRTEYPWPKMGVGDSVAVPKSASSSARGFVERHRPGWKVREWKMGEDDPDYVAGLDLIRVLFEEDPDAGEVPVDAKMLPGGLDADEAAESADSEIVE